jgi:hypothetical protein
MLGRPPAERVASVRADLRIRRVTYPSDEQMRAELAGRDLLCHCPLGQPCHADVLIEIANRPGQSFRPGRPH